LKKLGLVALPDWLLLVQRAKRVNASFARFWTPAIQQLALAARILRPTVVKEGARVGEFSFSCFSLYLDKRHPVWLITGAGRIWRPHEYLDLIRERDTKRDTERKDPMKKSYDAPVVRCLGSVEGLTLTNLFTTLSDVPYGDESQEGSNVPS